MVTASAGSGVVKEAAWYVPGGNIIYIAFLLSIPIHIKTFKMCVVFDQLIPFLGIILGIWIYKDFHTRTLFLVFF